MIKDDRIGSDTLKNVGDLGGVGVARKCEAVLVESEFSRPDVAMA